jgi:hypothetical protein
MRNVPIITIKSMNSMRRNGTIIASAHLVSRGEAIPCVLNVERGERTRATATVENVTDRARQVVLEFQINGTVPLGTAELCVHLPLTANGLFDHHALKSVSEPGQLVECEQTLSLRDPQASLLAHYLEPAASHPGEQRTRAPLLIPLVEWFVPGSAQRFAMLASPERAWRFSCKGTDGNSWQWFLQTLLTLQPGESRSECCWLLDHSGGTREAWRAFHQLARGSDLAVPDWLRKVRVHYFDFLSADGRGRRGPGYDESAIHFRDFGVGLATQHGYYPFWGDYVHPGRTQWQAMRNDAAGEATMSLDLMRARIAASRRAGTRAGIYIHLVGFDGASPLNAELADAALMDASGQPVAFGWNGPDVLGPVRFMSIGAPAWRRHLLQQAQWIMELLAPDAIIVDETFAYVGYDNHPDRRGPTSVAGIQLMKDLRALVRSFGPEKAVLSSDCGLGSMVMWADGEGGDHAYENLVGHPLYRKDPVRYLAALGDKPWQPCAWQAWKFWDAQVELAKACGAGMGVSDGWIEYTGLARMAAEQRQKMLADIGEIRRQTR